jgi:membrane protease YdiL (CAAX protease family)
MNRESGESTQSDVRSGWGFFALAFAITWIIWLPVAVLPQKQEQLEPLIIVGGFGPWLAAMVMTWSIGGRAGLWRWLRRIFKWRISIVWCLVGILVLPVGGALLHFGLYLLLGGQADFSEAPPWYWFIPALLATALLSGGNEEPGWRGFALPRLLERYHPIAASCIIAPFWAAWHLPLYLATVWSEGESMVLVFVYVIPLSIIMTWLTLKSEGSVIPAMLFHGGGNVYSTWFPMETVMVGSVAVEFNALKAVVYATIALVLIITTRGQLGYRAYSTQQGAHNLKG